MSVECYRESPRKFDSRTLNRKTLNRWTGRTYYSQQRRVDEVAAEEEDAQGRVRDVDEVLNV